ncbi:MAG: carboxymuconolactone decarboxylase family protein [Stellaceae bacterium]
MARISAPTEMNAEQQAIADRLKQTIGQVGGPYGAWIHRPALCARIQQLSDYFRGGTVLPPKLRMIGVLMSIRHWGADFPWTAQVPHALNAGLTHATVAAIGEGKIPSFTDLDEEAAYQVASELLERRSLSDATYRRALDRLGEEVLIELVAVLGHFSTVSLTALAFDIQPTRTAAVPLHKG